MADVFLAHDDVLDRDVALKVMSARYASDEEFVERFKREAQSAAALSHPNIVSIFDRGAAEDGTYYIAMEYLPGGTLKDRILKRGALPPRKPAYTRDLPRYYETLHRQQPRAALFVTEFGAEANRRGPAREKGTYAFQSRYLRRHVEQAAAPPFLNGAVVWALRDFRVHSAWTGDNPKPHPPWNQKGIIGAGGRPKPAYYEVRRTFRRLADKEAGR